MELEIWHKLIIIKAKASFVYEGPVYSFSAVMGIEVASVIRGTLGMAYFESLRWASAKIVVETLR